MTRDLTKHMAVAAKLLDVSKEPTDVSGSGSLRFPFRYSTWG